MVELLHVIFRVPQNGTLKQCKSNEEGKKAIRVFVLSVTVNVTLILEPRVLYENFIETITVCRNVGRLVNGLYEYKTFYDHGRFIET